jgi:hypothetical protein
MQHEIVFYSYFKQYPEAQKEFKAFNDVPIDELSKNKRFQAHCANIVATLGKVIEQMHDPELMEASVINFTEKHKNRGQTQKQFEVSKCLSSCLLHSFFDYITTFSLSLSHNNFIYKSPSLPFFHIICCIYIFFIQKCLFLKYESLLRIDMKKIFKDVWNIVPAK